MTHTADFSRLLLDLRQEKDVVEKEHVHVDGLGDFYNDDDEMKQTTIAVEHTESHSLQLT